jgi:hypothetical protein
MRGAIPPLPNTPSWRGAQLRKEAKLLLYKVMTILTLLYGSENWVIKKKKC